MSVEPEHLSDVVARQIVLFRKRQDMTRDALAAACAKLGCPELTGPALANIETGRRGPEGQRRRDVTVDELVVLAAALGVPPLMLLFPVGDSRATALLPGRHEDTWAAARWFTGEDGSPGVDGEPARSTRMMLHLYRAYEAALTTGDKDAVAGTLGEMGRCRVWPPTSAVVTPASGKAA